MCIYYIYIMCVTVVDVVYVLRCKFIYFTFILNKLCVSSLLLHLVVYVLHMCVCVCVYWELCVWLTRLSGTTFRIQTKERL